MSTTTKPKLSARVRAANRRFRAMSAAEKRVAIAKDVLLQLKLGTYKAEEGTYTDGTLGEGHNNPDAQLCDVIQLNKESPCRVCARGAMFVSAVMQFDRFKVEDANFEAPRWGHLCAGPSFFGNYENKFFSRAQADLIEACFEGYRCNLSDAAAATRFYAAYDTATERMTAIMKNIVKNKGTFVMPKKFIQPKE